MKGIMRNNILQKACYRGLHCMGRAARPKARSWNSVPRNGPGRKFDGLETRENWFDTKKLEKYIGFSSVTSITEIEINHNGNTSIQLIEIEIKIHAAIASLKHNWNRITYNQNWVLIEIHQINLIIHLLWPMLQLSSNLLIFFRLRATYLCNFITHTKTALLN